MENPKHKLLSFAYFLDSSKSYNKIKKFVYDLIENDEYKYKRYFDLFMIFVILSSVTLLVMDVKSHIPRWLDDFDFYFVTTVFIVEYILRMWVYSDIHKIIIDEYEECSYFDKEINLFALFRKIAKDKWAYMTSFSAIIDLIAILPSYRGFRILRVFVLFRAFKMLRYTKSLTGFLYVLKNKKFELITLLTLSTFFIFIAGIMLYVFEGDNKNPNIHNLFDAFYWALITISTVGYGDIAPVTPEGRVVTMLIIFTGIGLISFVTSIIVSSFNERLSVLREDRVVQEVGKKKKLTVVCGYGLLGRLVVQGLKKEGVEFIVIDRSEEMATMAYNDGHHAICADATKGTIFKKLGITDRISHVLCLTSDDIQNTFIAVNVKSLNNQVYVTARCSDQEIASKMEYAHVDQVIMPEEVAGMMGAVYAGEPVAFEVLLAIVEEKDKTHINEITIAEGSFLDNKRIDEVDFEKLRLILLGVFKHSENSKLGEFIFNPSDDFVLNAGDNLICIGYSTAVANLKRKM
ncbi:Potassium voltage-gated channel subfamily KQT; possible potassium channel, VIC family [hydrothermal vent metagenome]|uniref:BK channel n=1 Tax=hydrothermal vent metagenome TaxID=652676 RepID=A0A1W1CT57_9ZZZZ